MSFALLNDEYLIYLSRRHKFDAFNIIYKRYISYSQTYLRRYFQNLELYLTKDEIFSTIVSVFIYSLKRFNFSQGNFYSYWVTLLRNRFLNEVRDRKNRLEKLNGFNYISLDEKIRTRNDDDTIKVYHEIFGVNDDPALEFNAKDTLRLAVFDSKKVTKLDKEILMFYLDGYEMINISKMLKINVKQVRRVIARLKDTYASFLEAYRMCDKKVKSNFEN